MFSCLTKRINNRILHLFIFCFPVHLNKILWRHKTLGSWPHGRHNLHFGDFPAFAFLSSAILGADQSSTQNAKVLKPFWLAVLQQKPELGKKEAPITSEGQFPYVVPRPVGSTWRLPETPRARVPQLYEVERTLCILKNNTHTHTHKNGNKILEKSSCRRNKKGPKDKCMHTHMKNEFLFWLVALPSYLPQNCLMVRKLDKILSKQR